MPKKIAERIQQEVKALQIAGRDESATFLIWFLQNVFRIDPEDAPDMVCDSRNDKGIDGILVDELAAEVVLFSSKFYRSAKERGQGDNDIRNLVGAAKWFESPETVDNLLKSTASPELKSLVTRSEVARKLQEGYSLSLVFISSLEFDQNALDFVTLHQDGRPALSGWDARRLNEWFQVSAKDDRVHSEFSFSIIPGGHFIQTLAQDVQVVILPLMAKEIASLDGLDDRSLFARNVRLPLGSTRVNRDIKAAIVSPDEHENFLLYHNGITIVCDKLVLKGNKLTISGYSVVNGCQSVITFYENRKHLTDNLTVLAKIVRVARTHEFLVNEITNRSNNQNPTYMRDQRSNDRIQAQIQADFNAQFGDKVFYARKRGERSTAAGVERLENDMAAQILLAFEVKRPENAHQKWKLFDEYYLDIFSRHITAARIYFAYRVYQAVEAAFQDVEDEPVHTYKLAKFFILYVIRRALEKDPLGKQILENPTVPIMRHEQVIRQTMEQLAKLLIRQFNFIIQKKRASGYFDYKSEFKSRDIVQAMADEIITGYETALVLYPDASIRSLLTTKGNIAPEVFFQDTAT